jgi:hypothetical protein
VDEDKGKETPPGETPPSISSSPSISREENLASLDTLQASMRLEMKAMFEEYLGKKSPGLTNPNTTPSVDLSLAKVKPPNNGSTSAENKQTIEGKLIGNPADAFFQMSIHMQHWRVLVRPKDHAWLDKAVDKVRRLYAQTRA